MFSLLSFYGWDCMHLQGLVVTYSVECIGECAFDSPSMVWFRLAINQLF